MQLIKFFLYAAIGSLVFGELAKYPLGGTTSIALTDLFLALALTSFLVWKFSLNQRILLPGAFRWLAGFCAICLVSLVYSLTFIPLIEVLTGALYLARFVLYMSVLVITFNLLKSNALSINSLINLMIGVSVILALLGFIQLTFYPNLEDPPFYLTELGYDPHRGRLTSTFLDPNFLGSFLVLSLSLIWGKFYKAQSKVGLFVAGLVSLAILLTLSRSAYLMTLTSCIVLFFVGYRYFSELKHRASIVLLIISTIMLLAFLPQVHLRIFSALRIDASSYERFESWDKGLTIFQSYPALGVGFNNLRYILTNENLIKAYTTEGGHAGAGIDSSLLFVLATTGVVGFTFYVLFWLQYLRLLYKKGNLTNLVLFSVLVGLLVNSQFINSLFFPAIMLWVFLILAIGDFSGENS